MVKNNKNLFFFSIFALVFVLDLIIKQIMYIIKPNVNILPFFSLNYVENLGAGFGTFQNQEIFLILIALAFLITVFYYYKKFPNNKMLLVSIALACGGALGNLYDRIFRHFVIDYLDLYIHNLHWPAFNLADSALVIGAIIFVIYNYKEGKN